MKLVDEIHAHIILTEIYEYMYIVCKYVLKNQKITCDIDRNLMGSCKYTFWWWYIFIIDGEYHNALEIYYATYKLANFQMTEKWF